MTDEEARVGEIDGVSDPSDMKQARRIKSILDARENVKKQHRKALDLLSTGEIDTELAQRILRVAVTEYALESEHVIKDHLPENEKLEQDDPDLSPEEEAAIRVWYQSNLGEIPMQTKALVFQGLNEFLNAPQVIQESWQEQTEDPIRGIETTTHTAEYEIPINISREAFRELNHFWNKLGLDVDMDEKLPTDYL